VIKPRTPNQAQYIANILDHDITFGVGPAGLKAEHLEQRVVQRAQIRVNLLA
jgi:phosphate starvation-inducible protein PhoH